MTARRLQELLGIERPVMLGAFGGVSSIALTAAVSDLGGLGSYGLYGYAPERIRETAAALRSATAAPFALNLWVPRGDEAAPGAVDLGPARAAAAPLFERLGIPLPEEPAAYLPEFDAQLEAAIEARPAVLSFVYGLPSRDAVETAKAAGVRIIGTATTVAEARALEAGGADAIVASGFEAGGHRVSFLRPAEESLVGTFALVPQVVDAVAVPVFAAGGVADRRGVAAALALGASGVVVGTAFLRTRQSGVPESHRRALAAATDDATVLTRVMSGRLARGLPNDAVRTLEAADATAPFPAQNWLTGRFRAVAAEENDAELLSLWAGQAAALAVGDDVREVFRELVAGLPGGGSYGV